MTEDGTDALEQALALYATPAKLSMLHEWPLPRAVLLLIRIAAGDAEAIAAAAARTAETADVIVDASVLYIQQALFHESADSYRLLGVPADAGADTIKEHYRWLMRWLHPDRHPDRWEVVYSERVNRAWNSLSSEQRRRDYDVQAHALVCDGEVSAAVVSQRGTRQQPDLRVPRPLMSSRTVRRLPTFVLCGLAVVATICVVFISWMQQDDRTASMEAPGKSAAQVAVGDSNPQEDAVRQRVAFEEHVIELSQPVLPSSQSAELHASVADPVRAPDSETPVVSAAGGLSSVSISSHPVVSHSVESAPAAIVPAPLPARDRAMPVIAASTSAAVALPHAEPAPMHASAAIAAQPLRVADILPTVPIVHAAALPANAMVVTIAEMQPRQDAIHAMSPPTVASADGISPQHAEAIVTRAFEDAYADGNLSRMMRLFAPDAVDNRGGIDAIRDDYDHLFRDSSTRALQLDGLKWSAQPDRIVGSGDFEAQIRFNDASLATRVHGWIQIEAVPIDGDWKIQRLLHRTTE